jgi:outer membrane protein assembly factor BamB
MALLGSVAVVPDAAGVVGVDATTGRVRWRRPEAGFTRLIGSVGGLVWLERDGRVVAVDARGRERWRSAVFGYNLLQVGRWLSVPDRHELLALDPRTGVITARLGAVSSFVAIGNTAAVVRAPVVRSATVTLVDAHGRSIWSSAPLPTDGTYGGVSSVDEAGSTVIIISASSATGDHRIVALDRGTGRLRFLVDGVVDARISPTTLVSDRWQPGRIAGSFIRRVEARDPLTGRRLWSTSAPATAPLGGFVSAVSNDVLFARGRRSFVHVDLAHGPDRGLVLSGALRNPDAAPTAAGVLVTGGDDVRRVALVDPATADVEWGLEAPQSVVTVRRVGSTWLVQAANPIIGCD